jgi:hypothetical protein
MIGGVVEVATATCFPDRNGNIGTLPEWFSARSFRGYFKELVLARSQELADILSLGESANMS